MTEKIEIPPTEYEFSFARSGGPGGQNVNKVNSKAILRWSPVNSASLPDAVKSRFLEKYASRITLEGELIITSQKFRDQNRNAEDCLLKLDEMIGSVTTPPVLRRKTKPSKASVARRVEGKRITSAKKQQRRVRIDD
ncbi:MAG: aminoacyl-tRNA hydrolase [Candidatus Obscuribacterales bacterium]|nr:aminoacyl-tRNA hydrolase [Candidatus Obscuribacterales bacterium]